MPVGPKTADLVIALPSAWAANCLCKHRRFLWVVGLAPRLIPYFDTRFSQFWVVLSDVSFGHFPGPSPGRAFESVQ